MLLPAFIEQLDADLQKLDQVDPLMGAVYRERAQDILATPSIALKIREAIAERLGDANQLLSLKTVERGDSY